MVRPKKGTKENELATARWRKTMEQKYGGKKELHRVMQEIGAKGGRNGHTGGFAANKELARLAGAKGGAISRRGPGKKPSHLDQPIEPKENLNASSDFVEHTYKKKFKWPWSK